MRPESSGWAYDVAARVYDDDMAASAPVGDVEYYVSTCLRREGPVLELGAGTGRVTLPVVNAGKAVTAVDRSEPMLAVLAAKADARLPGLARARLTVLHADMRDLPALGPYDTILCPYSAFTYLLSGDDRSRMLLGVKERLAPTGRFVLDVFVPDPGMHALADDHVIFDYRRPLADGTVLQREKVIAKDVEPGINRLERRYTIFGPDGEVRERFSTCSTIHYWSPDALRTELEAHGFSTTLVVDFGKSTGLPPRTSVFECERVR